MCGKLEARKTVMGDISIDCKLAAEDAKRQEEQLNAEVRSLLVAGTALSVSRKQLLVILVYTQVFTKYGLGLHLCLVQGIF